MIRSSETQSKVSPEPPKADYAPYQAPSLAHFPSQAFPMEQAEIYPMWSGEGNLSYLIVNGERHEAILIDPDLEILGAYLITLDQHRLTLVGVIDTHTHADHASAAPSLRRLLGTPYFMNHRSTASTVSDRLADRDERLLAGLKVQFLYSPGHAPDLQVVLIGEHLFTGDSLFNNSSGRTDLPGGNAGLQFDTLHRLICFPDYFWVHPGHDYNNCLSRTIGEIREHNPRVQIQDRDVFIRRMRETYATEEKPSGMDYFVSINSR